MRKKLIAESKYMKIGDKIRQVRKIKGFKQGYVSTMVHLSVTDYSNIERNKSDVLFGKLEEIAAVLEVTVADIIRIPDKSVIKSISGAHTGINFNNENSDTEIVSEEIQVYRIALEITKMEIEHLRGQNEELIEFLNKISF